MTEAVYGSPLKVLTRSRINIQELAVVFHNAEVVHGDMKLCHSCMLCMHLASSKE